VLVNLRADVERAGIDSAKARAAITAEQRAAGAAMNFAHDKLKRSEGLVERGFIAPLALDQVRSEYEVARQKYLQAEEQQRIAERDLHVANAQLDVRRLKSPVDGIVLDRYANPGERVELKPILKVGTIDRLRIEVVMPASQFGTIRRGDAATVTPDVPGAKALPVQVALVDPAVDAASNTFRVRFRLANPDRALPASARCRIEFAGVVGKPAPAAGAAVPDGLNLRIDPSLGPAAAR
jgi:RND family efflux transporter MFP subunit